MYWELEEKKKEAIPFSEQNLVTEQILRKLADAIYWNAMYKTRGDVKAAERLIDELSEKASQRPLDETSISGAYFTYLGVQSQLLEPLNDVYERSKNEEMVELAESAIFSLQKCEEMFEKVLKFK